MKPPICEVCDERFDPVDGELVSFVGDAASEAFEARAEQPGFVGHPPNLGWFCGQHVEAARTRTASMTLRAALLDIAGQPPSTPEVPSKPARDPLPVDKHGEPLRGPFLPMPDASFDRVEVQQHEVAGRVATDALTILAGSQGSLRDALGVRHLRGAGSISSPSSDPADVRWIPEGATCSTTVASFHGNDVAVFVIAGRHLVDKDLRGEHARLLVQQREQTILEVVVAAGSNAIVAPDGRVLLDRAHVRVADGHGVALNEAIDGVLAALNEPAPDPFELGPDIEGVDLGGGVVRRSIGEGESSIEWKLAPVALATARQQFVELVPLLFSELGVGPVPELEVVTRRDWNPMDGSREPNCPYVDHVIQEVCAPDGRTVVSVQSDQAHWSDDDISNVSTSLYLNVEGVQVHVYAAGRGHHDSCTSLSLFRPTSAVVIALLTAAFSPWLD